MDRHNKRVRVWIGILLITIVILAGCSTLTLQQIEDRYDRNLMTRELYAQCRGYKKARGELVWRAVYSTRRIPSVGQMRDELIMNHCPRELL